MCRHAMALGVAVAVLLVIVAMVYHRHRGSPHTSASVNAVVVDTSDLRFGRLPNCKGQSIVCDDDSEVTCDNTINQLRCEAKCKGQTYACEIGQEVYCDSERSQLACRSICSGSPEPQCRADQELQYNPSSKQYVCQDLCEAPAREQAKVGMSYQCDKTKGALVEYNRCDEAQKPTCFDEGYDYAAPQCQLSADQSKYQWVCPCQKDYIASLAPPPPPCPHCIIHSQDINGAYYSLPGDDTTHWYYTDREGNYHYNCQTRSFEFVKVTTALK